MQQLINALSLVDGVVGVGLGGSRGLGIADENSDYDFVLCRKGGGSVAAQSILDAASPCSDLGTVRNVHGFIRGAVSGKKFEIFQLDLLLVEKALNAAKEGKFSWYSRGLFPHGDLSTSKIKNLVYLEICSDKNNEIGALQEMAQPLPDVLQSSLIRYFLNHASATIIHISKIKKAYDLQYVIALCSEFVFFSNIILFAINSKYPVIERGGARLILDFPLRPENYERRTSLVFRAAANGHIAQVIPELSSLLQEIKLLGGALTEAKQALPM